MISLKLFLSMTQLCILVQEDEDKQRNIPSGIKGRSSPYKAQEDYSNDGLYELLSKYVSDAGVKTGFVMWPIRTAVSGKQMTPAGATEIMEVLGKEESLARIRRGIELLEA